MRRRFLTATLAVIVTGLVVAAFTPPRPASLPARFDNAVLAAELVRDADEIRQVYGTDAAAQRCRGEPATRSAECVFVDTLRRNTLADFLFIGAYASLFFLLARLLPVRAARVVRVMVVFAAMADCAENIGMLRAMEEPASDLLAKTICVPSLVKWALLSLVWSAVGYGFLAFIPPVSVGFWRRLALRATGLFYPAGGVLCLALLIQGSGRLEYGVELVAIAIFLPLFLVRRDDALFDAPAGAISRTRL